MHNAPTTSNTGDTANWVACCREGCAEVGLVVVDDNVILLLCGGLVADNTPSEH